MLGAVEPPQARARRPVGSGTDLESARCPSATNSGVTLKLLRRWRALQNSCQVIRQRSVGRMLMVIALLGFLGVASELQRVLMPDGSAEPQDMYLEDVTCPQVYTSGAERKLIPTMRGLWPDHRVGEIPPHPEIYSARDDAREKLGPIFWVKAPEQPPCFMVVIDAKLGESIFARDGTDLGREFDYLEEAAGLKFVYGKNFTRQRNVLMREVLTDAAKQQRGIVAAPVAAQCILKRLRESVDASMDLLPTLRECMAVFIVTAVMGEHWKGLQSMIDRLLVCETSPCGGLSYKLLGPFGDSFTCLKAVMSQEATYRLETYYKGASGIRDPDADSLFSKMLRLTPQSGRAMGEGYLNFNEVIVNGISFVSAGWETSTLTMINTFWFLTAWTAFPRSEEVQNQVRQEAAKGKNGLSKRILQETLSWRPPIPWHAGNTDRQMEAALNGIMYQIPSDTRIVVDILGMNRLPRMGPIGSWDPETNKSRKIEEHAGGVGGRHCPGGKVVRHGIAVILGLIFQEFTLMQVRPRAVEDWLQAYTGNLIHDLCSILFDTSLQVMPRRWPSNSEKMRND